MSNQTAGPVRVTRARSTGTVVEVWRAADYGLDAADGGPWVTACYMHGDNCQHATRDLAVAWSAHPDVWCDGCRV